MKKCIFIGSLIFFSSCGIGHLTTEQRGEINKIDKQMDELWINYSYSIDSLYIKRDSIIENNGKFKECCIKTSNDVYKHEGLTID